MTTMNTGALKSLFGKSVIAVYGLVYHRSGVFEPEPASVWIRCDGDIGIRISCEGDGMHLICDRVFTWPFDMQNDGAYVLADLSHLPPWSQLRGKRIEGLDVLVSRISIGIIGVGLRDDEAGQVLYIINLGDELCPFATLPEEIVSRENVEIVRMYGVSPPD